MRDWLRSGKDGNIEKITGRAGCIHTDGKGVFTCHGSQNPRGAAGSGRAARNQLAGYGTLYRKRELTCTHTTVLEELTAT